MGWGDWAGVSFGGGKSRRRILASTRTPGLYVLSMRPSLISSDMAPAPLAPSLQSCVPRAGARGLGPRPQQKLHTGDTIRALSRERALCGHVRAHAGGRGGCAHRLGSCGVGAGGRGGCAKNVLLQSRPDPTPLSLRRGPPESPRRPLPPRPPLPPPRPPSPQYPLACRAKLISSEIIIGWRGSETAGTPFPRPLGDMGGCWFQGPPMSCCCCCCCCWRCCWR
jgi:hypothetical protein